MNINEMISESKEVLLSPKTAFQKMADKANLWDGALYLAIGFLLYGLIQGILIPLVTNQELNAMMIIYLIVIGIIFTLFYTAIIWIFARLLGGNGRYDTQFRMISVPHAVIIVLNGILSLFLEILKPLRGVNQGAGAIPILFDLIINILFILIFVIVLLNSLYFIYLLVCAISEAHKISKLRAFAAWLLGVIILVILVLLIYLL